MTQRIAPTGYADWLLAPMNPTLRDGRTHNGTDPQRLLATIESALGVLFQSTGLTSDQLDSVRHALGAVDELRGVVLRYPRPHGRVLVADHDATRGEAVRHALAQGGYTVDLAYSCETVMDRLVAADPQVIVLSQRLLLAEDRVCSRLRAATKARIVVLLEPTIPRANGLARLADDVVVKPWPIDEIVRRVTSLLRTQADGDTRLEFGPLKIEMATRTVSMDDKEIHLTPTEYDLLYHLAVERGRVLTHDELLQRVWGEQYVECSDYLWVHLSRLRRKLSLPGYPQLIVTERGVGYRLRMPR